MRQILMKSVMIWMSNLLLISQLLHDEFLKYTIW